MTRGRKPIPAPEPEVIDVAAEARAEQALVVMRDHALADEMQIRTDVYRLGQLVGARQMAQTAANFFASADIVLLDEIGKSKAYKHVPIQHPDGQLRPAGDIREFCALVFKKSYRSFAESRQLLKALGEESYELARDLGLPRAQLRLLVNLPEDERAAVEEAMRQADTDGGRDEVVTIIQSLANKLDEARAQAEDLKADLQATQEVSAEKSAQIDRLKEERVRVKALPPDQVQAELRQEVSSHVNTALGMLNGLVAQGFGALCDHDALHGQDSLEILAGHVAQLQRAIYALRDDFNLSDYVGDGTPEWMRATADDADLSPEA